MAIAGLDRRQLTAQHRGAFLQGARFVLRELGHEDLRHSANCVRALPHVFDPRVRPWVTPAADSADRIAAAIERCPSGAVRYSRTDGGPAEVPDVPVTLTPIRNGPLYVRGDAVARALDGSELRRDHRMSLCRCDLSERFAFCDNTCRKTGWTEPRRDSLEGPTGGPESAAPSGDGDSP